MEKQRYTAPEIEVIPFEAGNVICSSNDGPIVGGGGGSKSNSCYDEGTNGLSWTPGTTKKHWWEIF